MDLKAVIIIFNLVTIVTPITIKCEYHDNGDWWVMKGFYYCNAVSKLNIYSPNDAMVENSTGKHLAGKSFDDVVGFEADNMTVEYFPKGLENIFKNLKMIDINFGRMKEIHQSDLKPFPELICLEIYENDIEVLEEGLFDYNPKLEMVWLSSNKIYYIHEALFDNLPKLHYLSLHYNRCISLYAEDNRTATELIIDYSKINCKDFIYMRKIFPEFMKKFDRIEDELKSLMNQSWINVNNSSSEAIIYHPDNNRFWYITIFFIGGLAMSIIGFLVYREFFIQKSSFDGQISFENQRCE